MQSLVEEFLINGWPTYGLQELERQEEDEDEDAAAVRLDRQTRELAKGNKASLDKAQIKLGEWLKKKGNAEHELYEPLLLRRVLILKKLHDFQGAIKDCKVLLARNPKSAALNCLLGILYGWLSTTEDWKIALGYYDTAIDLADTWWEPRLERIEKMFYLGLDSREYWRQIVESTAAALDRGGILTNREQLILWTHRGVAQALLDPAHVKTNEFGKAAFEVDRIQIPEGQHEEWDLRRVFRVVVKSRYAGDDEPAKSVRLELHKLLGDAHAKLMPGEKWTEV